MAPIKDVLLMHSIGTLGDPKAALKVVVPVKAGLLAACVTSVKVHHVAPLVEGLAAAMSSLGNRTVAAADNRTESCCCVIGMVWC